MDITVAGAVSAWAPSSAGGVCIVREGKSKEGDAKCEAELKGASPGRDVTPNPCRRLGAGAN